jgi:hypothetical protein
VWPLLLSSGESRTGALRHPRHSVRRTPRLPTVTPTDRLGARRIPSSHRRTLAPCQCGRQTPCSHRRTWLRASAAFAQWLRSSATCQTAAHSTPAGPTATAALRGSSCSYRGNKVNTIVALHTLVAHDKAPKQLASPKSPRAATAAAGSTSLSSVLWPSGTACDCSALEAGGTEASTTAALRADRLASSSPLRTSCAFPSSSSSDSYRGS